MKIHKVDGHFSIRVPPQASLTDPRCRALLTSIVRRLDMGSRMVRCRHPLPGEAPSKGEPALDLQAGGRHAGVTARLWESVGLPAD